MAKAGDNSDKLLKSYVDRISDLMDQINTLKDEVKDELKGAKEQGLEIKALMKIVKELGMEQEQRERQLEFEFTLDNYRRVVGLPTELGALETTAVAL